MSEFSLSAPRVRAILRGMEERAPFFTQRLMEDGGTADATEAEILELLRLGYLERHNAEHVVLTTQAHIFLRGID